MCQILKTTKPTHMNKTMNKTRNIELDQFHDLKDLVPFS